MGGKNTGHFKREFAKFTPLMLAAASSSENNLACLKALLVNNANYNAKDSYGNSLLHIAA